MVKDIANTWLVSNSQIYFANRILMEEDSPNMYSLFDLSNLVETIILAEQIVTLPGEAIETQTATCLKKEGILKQVKVEQDMASIITSLKSTWDDKSIAIQNKQHIAKILCDIFPVEYDIAYQAVSKSNKWADNVYRTPNWSVTKEFTRQDVSADISLSGEMSHRLGLQYFFTKYYKANPKEVEDMMTETYVRALFYLMIASSRNYNYCPDSIRIPIVAFLSRIYLREVYKTTKEIMVKLDKMLAKKINLILKAQGYRTFEIRVPSAFSMVLKNCKTREDILGKAIELRNTSDLKKFRHELTKLEESARNLDSNFLSRKKHLESILEPEEYNWEKILVDNLPKISDIDEDTFQNPGLSIIKPLARPVDAFARIGVTKLIKFLKNRNLLYLRKLGGQLRAIKSSQDKIEKVFGSKLSNEDIEILMKLRAYQNDYLPNLGNTNHKLDG